MVLASVGDRFLAWLRGEAAGSRSARVERQVSHVAEADQSETEQPAVPPWGILPSQVPSRVELIRGRSSIQTLREAWRTAAQFSVVVAVTGTIILLGRQDEIPLVWIVPLTLLGGGAVFAFLVYPAGQRMRREHQAGYTVWRRKAPELPQVDDRTAFVIRPAGAPSCRSIRRPPS